LRTVGILHSGGFIARPQHHSLVQCEKAWFVRRRGPVIILVLKDMQCR
jgi:hypothetical protein